MTISLTIPVDPASQASPVSQGPDKGPVNFMLLLYEAINKDQDSMAQQQILDASSAEIAVKFEEQIYTDWNSTLNADAGQTQIDVNNDPQQVPVDQQMYNWHSAEAQAAESQQDGAVQSDQGQTSSDSQNLQMKAQLAQGINSILTTLSGLLGRITA